MKKDELPRADVFTLFPVDRAPYEEMSRLHTGILKSAMNGQRIGRRLAGIVDEN